MAASWWPSAGVAVVPADLLCLSCGAVTQVLRLGQRVDSADALCQPGANPALTRRDVDTLTDLQAATTFGLSARTAAQVASLDRLGPPVSLTA